MTAEKWLEIVFNKEVRTPVLTRIYNVLNTSYREYKYPHSIENITKSDFMSRRNAGIKSWDLLQELIAKYGTNGFANVQ